LPGGREANSPSCLMAQDGAADTASAPTQRRPGGLTPGPEIGPSPTPGISLGWALSALLTVAVAVLLLRDVPVATQYLPAFFYIP
jgi:hypothetical protein